jgi:hypothetical protein
MLTRIHYYFIGASLVLLLFDPTRFIGLAGYAITLMTAIVKQLNATAFARNALIESSSGGAGCQVMATLESFKRRQKEARLQAFRQQVYPVAPPALPPPLPPVSQEGTPDAVRAMASLQLLLDKKLISQDEFDSKRQEILRRI